MQTLTPSKFKLKRSNQEHLSTNLSNISSNSIYLQTQLHSIDQKLQTSKTEYFQDKIQRNLFTTTKQKRPTINKLGFQFSQIVSNNIENDNKLSLLDSRLKRSPIYREESNRIITSQSFEIPNQIYQAVEVEEKRNEKKPNFIQGFIPQIGYSYYSVGNKLFVFSTKELINGKKISKVLQPPIIMQDILYTISEVVTNVNPYKPAESVLVFSHPYKLTFWSYKVNDGILQISNPLSLTIACQKVTLIDYDKYGTIYYLDSQGSLYKINREEQKIFSLFKPRRFNLKQTRIYQFVKNKQRNVQWLKYFSQTFYDTCQSLFSQSKLGISMFCDRQRGMLFTLGNYKTNLIHQTQSRIIFCYNINNQIKLIEKISEQQFFNNYKWCLKKITENNQKIVKISRVQLSYMPSSNIQILLKNGVKIYLDITPTQSSYVDVAYPPNFNNMNFFDNSDIQFKQKNSKKHKLLDVLKDPEQDILTSEPNNQTIICSLNSRGRCLTTFQTPSGTTTYFVNKKNQQVQRSRISIVKWKSNLKFEPTQFYFNQILGDCLVQPICQRVLKQQYLRIKNSKNKTYSRDLHELARQAIFQPFCYIYQTDLSVELLMEIRPIDLLYTILSSQNRTFLLQILNQYFIKHLKYSKEEVGTMLIQLLSDKSGVYFVNLKVKQKIRRFTREQNLGNQNKQKNNHIIKISFNQFPSDLKNEILQLLDELGNIVTDKEYQNYRDLEQDYTLRTQKIKKKILQDQSINLKIDCSLLYLSRIIRLVWNSFIDELTSEQITYILQKIESLKEIIDQILSYSFNQNKKIEGFKNFMTYLIESLNIIKYMTVLPRICLGNFINNDPKQAQQWLFKSSIQTYNFDVLNHWKRVFPSYITEDFIIIMKLYRQIVEENEQTNIEKIISKFQGLPSYFIRQIEKIKHINIYIPDNQRNKRTKKAKNQSVNIPKFKTSIETLNYIIKEVQNFKYLIKDKLFLLNYASQTINLMKKQQTTSIDTKYHQQDIQRFKKCLQIQQILIQEYCQIKQNTIQNYDIIQTLQCCIFSPQQLQKFASKLHSPKIKIVYQCFFGNNLKILQNQLHKLVQQYKNDWKQKIQADLAFIINKTNYNFPIAPIIQVLVQKSIFQAKQGRISTQIAKFADFKTMPKEQLNSQIKKRVDLCQIWIPQFIEKVFFKKQQIFNHFVHEFKKANQIYFGNSLQQPYLYIWLTTLQWVKQYQPQNIRKFIKLSEENKLTVDIIGEQNKRIIDGIQNILCTLKIN